MTTPKIDTQAPEQLGTSRELVERIARVIEDGDLFAPAIAPVRSPL